MRRFPRSGVHRRERLPRSSTFPVLLLAVLLLAGVAASAAPVAEERGVYLMDLFAGSHTLAKGIVTYRTGAVRRLRRVRYCAMLWPFVRTLCHRAAWTSSARRTRSLGS